MRIRLDLQIDAPPEAVWAELSDLSSHAEWMADAQAVNFASDQTRGVGTEMRVPTRIGPLRTDDVIIVTEWEEGRLLAVGHHGLVSGEGRFEIMPNEKSSVLVLTENLRFPWWLGGPLTAALARPVLKRIWRGNLERLRERVTEANAL